MTEKGYKNIGWIGWNNQRMDANKGVVNGKIKNLLHSYSFSYNDCRPAG